MVMGDSCTRGCRFCSVASAARPGGPDPEEPQKLADTLAEMALDAAVITTVCRDDLPDQGAGHLAECIPRRQGTLARRCAWRSCSRTSAATRTRSRSCSTPAPTSSPTISETVHRLTPLVRDAQGTRL